jgi:hypothetical protein
MPFTGAHPAIVLPFIRLNPKYISATGLVIGSVSPDFEYFLKMDVSSRYSHTISGIFYFDIPVAIFLAFVFHLIVKRNLILNLPAGLQKRFQELLRSDFREYFRSHALAFIVCAVAGASIHILWDSFTHNDTYFASRLEFINGNFIRFLGARYPMFFVLQQISTVVGLSAIVIYIIYLKPADVKVYRPSWNYWMWIFLIFSITLTVRFMISSRDASLANIVVTSVSGFFIAVVAMGFKKYNYNY